MLMLLAAAISMQNLHGRVIDPPSHLRSFNDVQCASLGLILAG